MPPEQGSQFRMAAMFGPARRSAVPLGIALICPSAVFQEELYDSGMPAPGRIVECGGLAAGRHVDVPLCAPLDEIAGDRLFILYDCINERFLERP